MINAYYQDKNWTRYKFNATSVFYKNLRDFKQRNISIDCVFFYKVKNE